MTIGSCCDSRYTIGEALSIGSIIESTPVIGCIVSLNVKLVGKLRINNSRDKFSIAVVKAYEAISTIGDTMEREAGSAFRQVISLLGETASDASATIDTAYSHIYLCYAGIGFPAFAVDLYTESHRLLAYSLCEPPTSLVLNGIELQVKALATKSIETKA